MDGVPKVGEVSPDFEAISELFCLIGDSASADDDFECRDRGLGSASEVVGVKEPFAPLEGDSDLSAFVDLGVEDFGFLVPERDLELEGDCELISSSASRCFFTFPGVVTGLLPVPFSVLDFL